MRGVDGTASGGHCLEEASKGAAEGDGDLEGSDEDEWSKVQGEGQVYDRS